MQKVVGSNPISRFARKPVPRAGFRVFGVIAEMARRGWSAARCPINGPCGADSHRGRRRVRQTEAMLFSLAEYETAARRAAFAAINALACAQSPLLAEIPSEEVAVIHGGRVSGASGQASYDPIKVRGDFELDISAVCTGDLDELLCSLDRLAEVQVRTVTAGFVERLNMVTAATGNEVNAKGGPLTHELIVELLDKMEINFDDAGNPQIMLFGGGDVAKRFASLPPMTEEQERAYEDVLVRKREEFEARRRRRIPPSGDHGTSHAAISP